MTDHLPVHELWARVMADVGGVAKRDRNTDQNFPFRGIDAILNAVGPKLRTHGVFVIPASVDILSEERYTTKRGANMHSVTVKVTWNVFGPKGDVFTGVTLGQAADSGDKVVTKAQTVAFRVFLINALALPTDEPDPDTHAHERAEPVDPMIQARQAAFDAAGRHVPSGLNPEEDRQARMAVINDALVAQGVTVADATLDHVRHVARLLETGEVVQPAPDKRQAAKEAAWEATLTHIDPSLDPRSDEATKQRLAVLNSTLAEVGTTADTATTADLERVVTILAGGRMFPTTTTKKETNR